MDEIKELLDSLDFSEHIMIIKDGEEFYPDGPPPEEPEPEPPREDFTYKDIENFYERVRSALNVGSVMISDEYIDYPENAPMAERKIKKRVPNWVELDDDKFALFQTCIVYMTCYILCPAVSSRRHIEQTTPSLTLKYADTSNDKPCERFLALIEDLLDEILDEEQNPFYGFEVTYPSIPCWKRKRWRR